MDIANGARGAVRTILYGIRYGAVKEAVDRGVVKVEHLPGVEMTADIFTKALGRILFRKYCERIVTPLK